MLRKLGLAVGATVILSVLNTNAVAQDDVPICSSNPPAATDSLWQKLRQLAQYGPKPDNSPGITQLPLPRISPFSRYYKAPQIPCVNTEKRISYVGFDHCNTHAEYQKVFPQAGCHCSTGQCRPTRWRSVPVSAKNPEGVEIEVNGEFYPLLPPVLHKFYESGSKMPDYLLNYDAHVCAFDPTPENPEPVIECGWIKIPS